MAGEVRIENLLKAHLAAVGAVIILSDIADDIWCKRPHRINTLDGVGKFNAGKIQCFNSILCILGQVSAIIAKFCLIDTILAQIPQYLVIIHAKNFRELLCRVFFIFDIGGMILVCGWTG